MTGMHPADYRKSLSNSKIPLLLLVGDKDEALYADKFESGVLPYQPDARISIIEDCNHLGITLHETAMREAAGWLTEISQDTAIQTSAVAKSHPVSADNQSILHSRAGEP